MLHLFIYLFIYFDDADTVFHGRFHGSEERNVVHIEGSRRG
jgi:hypothetical protein